MIKILYQLLYNREVSKKITQAHRNNLSVHDCQTVSFITQDCTNNGIVGNCQTIGKLKNSLPH